MMRNIKTFHPNALIGSEKFKTYTENFESEILRGISTLTILSIIERYPTKGIYGYKLLKELEKETHNGIVIEEGTLYPILRKFERDGFLLKEKVYPDIVDEETGQVVGISKRARTHYRLTPDGKILINHMKGFFSKLLESISLLMEFEIMLPKEEIVYCPNCRNRIDIKSFMQDADDEINYCNMCGYNLEGLR